MVTSRELQKLACRFPHLLQTCISDGHFYFFILCEFQYCWIAKTHYSLSLKHFSFRSYDFFFFSLFSTIYHLVPFVSSFARFDLQMLVCPEAYFKVFSFEMQKKKTLTLSIDNPFQCVGRHRPKGYDPKGFLDSTSQMNALDFTILSNNFPIQVPKTSQN